MRTTSATWPQLVAAVRQGVGVEVWLAIHIPSRNLVLTSRAWPDGWLPAGALVYPFLAPTGAGVNTFSIELADDRSSRLGTVSCQVLVTAGQVGSPPDPRLALLTSLAEHEALVYGLLRGGVSAPWTYERFTLFAGRVSAMTLTRGVLSFALVDGVAAEHRDLEIPLGSSVFPGSPTAAHGQAVPLIFGTALGLAPVLVAGDAQGTLATPLAAAAATTIDLVETAAPFPESGTLTIGSETLTYSGRRLGVLLSGQAALQLLAPVRSTPLAHAAGVAVTLASVTYRYLLGTGVPGLEVLAVRDDAGPVLAYTLVSDPPGTPTGTVVLETTSAHTGLQVDVQAIPVPPLPPLLNGGFESGTLDGWTVEAGTTAAVVEQEVLDGRYKLQLGTIPVGTTQGVWQDIAVEPGRRYVVHLAWRTPLETSANVVPNGAFTQPTLAPWVSAQTQGPPIPVTYIQGIGGERGQVQFTLPPGPPIPNTGPLPDPVQFRVTLTQESVAVLPGVTHLLAVEVWAFAQPPWWIPGAFIASPGGSLPRVDMFARVTETATGASVGFAQLQGYAMTAPAPSPGQWMRYLTQGQVTPGAVDTVTLTLTLSGHYWGTLPPISVRSILLSATPDADDGTTLQATALVELGLDGASAHYTSVQSSGSPDWEAIDIGFVAEAPVLRLALRGQSTNVEARVEYDSVRFLAPGRNPVTLMAAVFARFLPHLALNQASVQASEARRQSWLFGGYLPDPGRTDQLLVKMAQESWCTVFKDLDGVYHMTADDPDVQPVLSLQAERDVLRESLGLTWLGMDQVYTDFYLWYGRVTQATTPVPAGQYAAVLYVTPDASISQNPDLQPLCQQAAMTLRTRKRFDFYADLLSDPPTADRLLTRLVHQLAVLPEELTLTASVPALPLALTDRVQVRGGLLGPRPWVGDVRQTTLTLASQAPGLAVAVRLRRAGLRRGVWEEWEYTPLAPTLRVVEPWDPVRRTVRETWDPSPTGPWSWQTTFAGVPLVHALLAAPSPTNDLFAATGTRASDPAPTQAAVWRSSTQEGASPTTWTPALAASGGGKGTALTLFQFGAQLAAALRPTPTPLVSDLWQLGLAPSAPAALILALPDGVTVTSILDRSPDVYLGTSQGQVYRWSRLVPDPPDPPIETLTLLHSVAGGGVVHLWEEFGILAFVEHPDGLVVRYATSTDDTTWTEKTYTGLTGTRCSNVVRYAEETVAIATGTEAGERVALWQLLFIGEAYLLHEFTERGEQRPGPLYAAGSHAMDPYLYVGRHALNDVPLLELWGYDYTAATAEQWQLLQDFATLEDDAGVPDPNTSITAITRMHVREKVYAATGTPGAGTTTGARVYVSPTPD